MMGEDRTNTARPASLKRITSSDAFTAVLQQELASLTVVVETWRGVEPYEKLSSEEVCTLFQKLYAEMPRDLLFRAFREEIELAWFGSEGVVVRLGSGADEAVLVTYRNVRRVGEQEEQQCVAVDEIRRNGWVIYRKLRHAPPLGRV
jgi:hypothetical protein